jgi:hypothetical protein
MATTAQQFDLKGHILSLYGLTRESTRMARFFDASGRLIAERAVTADECWYPSCPAYWSNFLLADGPTSRSLGAASVYCVPDHELSSAPEFTAASPVDQPAL